MRQNMVYLIVGRNCSFEFSKVQKSAARIRGGGRACWHKRPNLGSNVFHSTRVESDREYNLVSRFPFGNTYRRLVQTNICNLRFGLHLFSRRRGSKRLQQLSKKQDMDTRVHFPLPEGTFKFSSPHSLLACLSFSIHCAPLRHRKRFNIVLFV